MTGIFRLRKVARCSTKHHEPVDCGESGQTIVLIIGYVLLTLLVVSVVASVSSVYLGHKRLLSVADSAALAAADRFTLTSAAVNVGQTTEVPLVSLTAQKVRTAVLQYLEDNAPSDGIDQLSMAEQTGSADGRSATVSLTAVVHPPFVNFLIPDGISISATSTARPQLRR